jgi:hypothetical protein
MNRIILPFRKFILLFTVAPRPSVQVFLPGLVLLTVWHLGRPFTATTPLFCLAVASGFATKFVLNVFNRRRTILERMPPLHAAAWIGTSALLPIILLLWAQDVRWCQNLFTLLPALQALVYLIDMLINDSAAALSRWPPDLSVRARQNLARAQILRDLAFALFNTTLITTVTPDHWLIWLALKPVADHYITSALATTVLLDLGEVPGR